MRWSQQCCCDKITSCNSWRCLHFSLLQTSFFFFFSLRLRDLRGLFQPLGFHHPPMAPFAPSSLWSCTDTRRQSEDGSVLTGGRRCIQNSRNENADNNVLFVMWKCSFSFLLRKKREVFEGYGTWSCFAADTAQMGICTS